jgi:hypothetical protein
VAQFAPSSPLFQPAGQTSPWVVWKSRASTIRNISSTLRPSGKSLTIVHQRFWHTTTVWHSLQKEALNGVSFMPSSPLFGAGTLFPYGAPDFTLVSCSKQGWSQVHHKGIEFLLQTTVKSGAP